MNPARLRLDFERPTGLAPSLGLMVLAAGILVTGVTLYGYRSLAGEVAALELRHDSIAPRDTAVSPTVERSLEEAKLAVHELSTPWSLMLRDLEEAGEQSNGDVALLSIEPDRKAGRVRILAEARTLPAALLYVHHLQQGRTLRGALLDKHEIQTKVAERPVRFELTANWAVAS